MLARTDASCAPAAVYAVVDRRSDGRPRVLYECRDPRDAVAAVRALAAAGDRSAGVVLVTRDDGV
jgi:hypothetical protein